MRGVKDVLNIHRRDVAVFLTSLLLAFGMWLLYNLNLSYSATLSARVYAESNIPGHFTISSEPVILEARCRTTGYRMIRNYRNGLRKPVTVALDPDLLHEDPDGSFVISSNELSGHVGEIFGSEVRLESFLMPTYSFRFPVENHKTVPVFPVAALEFKPQYMARSRMTVEPDSVMIYGDPAYLESIDRVCTRRISLAGISSSRAGSVRLEAPKGIRLSNESVNYSLEVTRYVEICRTIKVELKNAPAGKDVSIFPSTADAVFRCAFPMTTDRTGEVSFYIDYNDFHNSIGGHCAARVDDLPAGVIDCRLEPEVFECLEDVR